jgi:hypothetical protein
MARSARLISIDAVREMAVAVHLFADEVIAAIDELDSNVHRAVEWIQYDRPDYWKREVRRAWERVGEARADLEKALTYRKVADHTPDCRQERLILEKAKFHAENAEQVHRSLPQWEHRIDHAVRELTGARSLVMDWLRGDLPKALAALEQMDAALEAYAAATQPAAAESVPLPPSPASPAATAPATEPPAGQEKKGQS